MRCAAIGVSRLRSNVTLKKIGLDHGGQRRSGERKL
jgi:hypothetical protein